MNSNGWNLRIWSVLVVGGGLLEGAARADLADVPKKPRTTQHLQLTTRRHG